MSKCPAKVLSKAKHYERIFFFIKHKNYIYKYKTNLVDLHLDNFFEQTQTFCKKWENFEDKKLFASNHFKFIQIAFHFTNGIKRQL